MLMRLFGLMVLASLFPALALAASEAQKAGLSRAYDPLSLQASVALVADADTQEVIYSKNASASLPIASLTKLMAVVALLEAGLPLDQPIEITTADYDRYKNTRSRLHAGEIYTRGMLLHLALMSSENTAAAALGRTFPGGMSGIANTMNRTAQRLGMTASHFVETTGLSPENRSSANDLARLVIHASDFDEIRYFSTVAQANVHVGAHEVLFKNTNKLIGKPDWQIDLQKTGFINEAGRCLVMKAKVGLRNLVIVLLDSTSRSARFADAERIRDYVAKVPSLASQVSR